MNSQVIATIISAFGVIISMMLGMLGMYRLIQKDSQERIQELKKHFDERLDDKFEVVKADFRTVNVRFDKVEGRLNEVERRLGEVERRLHEVELEVKGIKQVLYKPIVA